MGLGRITNRLGPKNAMILSVVLFALGLTPFLFVHSLVGLWPPRPSSAWGSGLLVLVDVLIADVVDEDEVATGRRREGIFGANAFIIRPGVALQAIVFSAIMAAHGYDPNLATQPQTVIRGLRLIMAGFPSWA